MTRQNRTIALIFVAVLLAMSQECDAQRRLVQLSGVIFSSDSINVIPGANIYVPDAGRGTISNALGFFSLAVQVGDSVVITSIGYHPQHYIVPQSAPEYWTLIVEMTDDVTVLSDVTIWAYPNLEDFEREIVNTYVPLNPDGIDNKSLNSELVNLMARTTPMDGKANYLNYMSQYPGSIQNKFMPVTNPFFDVIRWAKFLKKLKEDKKKGDR